MQVDLGTAGARGSVEGGVERTNPLPVISELVERCEVEAAVLRGVLEGGDEAVEIRLRGRSGHRADRGVDDVRPRLDGGQHGGGIDAAGVVGVEVEREVGLGAESFKQGTGRERTAEAGHVLDRDKMRPHFFQLPGQLDVIFERILGAVGIKDVAGVADSAFAHGVRFAHGFHGRAHVREVIERVEDAEDVHSTLRCVADEARYDIRRVI